MLDTQSRRTYRNGVASLLLVGVCICCASLCGIQGCGSGVPPASGRVLVVGIDSADWSIIEPLLEAGRLQNLAYLIRSGVSCDLRSLEPKQKSPTIWATIATGKLPEKHGIADYIDPLTKNLLTSNVRTARPFWDIIGERGLSVTVVGWLVSWPAEEVNGYVITDYFHHIPRPDRPLPEHLTYPEWLLAEVESLRVAADDITEGDMARLMDLEAAMTEEEARLLPFEQMFSEMRALNELEQRTSALRDIVAGDRTYFGVAAHLMRQHPTDVSIVYLRGVDTASHKCWADAHPGGVGFKVSQTEASMFGHTVERYYELADEMLGELMSALGEGTVIVCSDHGFEGPKPGQLPGGTNDHGPLGILVMSGGPFRTDVRIAEASVQDVAPTLLALLGTPVADDMDGSVIEDAFRPGFLREHPVRHVPTYERRE